MPVTPDVEAKLVDFRDDMILNEYNEILSRHGWRNREYLLSKDELQSVEDELGYTLSEVSDIMARKGIILPKRSDAANSNEVNKPLYLAEGTALSAPDFDDTKTEIIDAALKLKRIKGMPECPETFIQDNAFEYASWVKNGGEIIHITSRDRSVKAAFVPIYILEELGANATIKHFKNVDFKTSPENILSVINQGGIAVLTTREGSLAALVAGKKIEQAQRLVYHKQDQEISNSQEMETIEMTHENNAAPATHLLGNMRLTANIRDYLQQINETGLPLVLVKKGDGPQMVFINEDRASSLIEKSGFKKSEMHQSAFLKNTGKIRTEIATNEILFLTTNGKFSCAVIRPENLELASATLSMPAQETEIGEPAPVEVKETKKAGRDKPQPAIEHDGILYGNKKLNWNSKLYIDSVNETSKPLVILDRNSIPEGVLIKMDIAQKMIDSLQLEPVNLIMSALIHGFSNTQKLLTDKNIVLLINRGVPAIAIISPALLDQAVALISPKKAAPIEKHIPLQAMHERAIATVQGIMATGSPSLLINKAGITDGVAMTKERGLALVEEFKLARQTISFSQFTSFKDIRETLTENVIIFVDSKLGNIAIASREYADLVLDDTKPEPVTHVEAIAPESSAPAPVESPAEEQVTKAPRKQKDKKPAEPAALPSTFNLQAAGKPIEALSILSTAINAAFSNGTAVEVKTSGNAITIVTDTDFIDYLAGFETEEVLEKSPDLRSEYGIHAQNVALSKAFRTATEGKNVLLKHDRGAVAFIGDDQSLEAYEMIKSTFGITL